VRRARLIPDSGGPGRWRGGLGVETVLEALDDAVSTVRGDRMTIPPPGRDGGRPGVAGQYRLDRRDGPTAALAPKQADVVVHAGDRLVVRTSGGGGLGPPLEREPELVLADVQAGRVTPAGAARDYAVILTAAGDAVDVAATKDARRARPARPDPTRRGP